MSILLSASLLLKMLGMAIPLGLAFVVLLQGRGRLNVLFSLTMLAVSLWNGGTFMLYTIALTGLPGSGLWLTMGLLGLLSLPLAFYLLALELSGLTSPIFTRVSVGVGLVSLAVIWAMILTVGLGIQITTHTHGAPSYTLSPFYPPLALTLAYAVGYCVLAEGVFLWPIYTARRREEATRESRWLLALGGALVLVASLLEVFPAIGQYPLDSVLMIAAAMLFAYLILKEQLFVPMTELNAQMEDANRRLQEANTALQASYIKVKEADRLKSEFVANISHELRTPLNAIIGFTKVILNEIDGPLTDTQREDLTAIYSSAQHLLHLVNDILDLSKIGADKMELHQEWVDIKELVYGVMATTITLLGDKDIKLVEKVADDLPPVYVDRTRIRQVILNLLSNAAKFTERGTITLMVDRLVETVQSPDGSYPELFLLFTVADTGIGIAPEDIPAALEEFRQVDSGLARQAEGTGLGLPISKRLVEMHGGRLWVESQVDIGSRFCFTLPFKKSSASEGGGESER
ncbi:MAG: HAMP domain-containing sensor histidine kinase [Chloroflexota bacterium]|nr:HAMP domain-containing sensor histidine kinase [Chloroflexota bacterium]